MTPAFSGRPVSRSRLAVLSVHTCPLAALGGKETGGMNVYVREVARALGRTWLRDRPVSREVRIREYPEVVPLGPAR